MIVEPVLKAELKDGPLRASPRIPSVYPWAFYGLILLNFPVRLFYLGQSLWLDEAWVANSVLEPTVYGMLFFDRWVQSTPPLTLLLMRIATRIFGSSEYAIRSLSLACGLAALFVFASLVRRIFGWLPGLLAVAFLSTNYWAIRYSQEGKQFGCDLLVSTLAVFLVYRLATSRVSVRQVAAFGIACIIGSLLSLPAVFFFPATIIAFGTRPFFDPELSNCSLRRRFNDIQHRAWMLLFAIQAAGVASIYWFFWHRNETSSFRRGIVNYGGAQGSLLVLLSRIWTNLSELMLPTNFLWTRILSPVIALGVIAGLVRVLLRSAKGDRRAIPIALAGAIPILTALVISTIGLYPLAPHPRLILWMLPSCALILFALIDEIWDRSIAANKTRRIAAIATPVFCGVASLAGLGLVLNIPRSSEDNRPAVIYLATHASKTDRIYVHGGVYEQVWFYKKRLNWAPENLYVGNNGWPCCSIDHLRRVSNPKAESIDDDVASLVAGVHNGVLWTIMPTASEGHWSNYLGPQIEQTMTALKKNGCTPRVDLFFGETEIYQLQCSGNIQSDTRSKFPNSFPSVQIH